jgi:hypothetical protein
VTAGARRRAADVGQEGVWCSVCNRSFKSQHALDVHIWVSAAHRDPNSLNYAAAGGGARSMYGGPHARRPGLGRSAVALAIREGASMRAKVCSVAEDAGVLMQAVVGGRTFFGMVREVLPAPLSDLHAPPGGSAAAAAAAAEGTLPRRRHQPKVVVIGAGFAGLAAAEELHAMGCKVRPPPSPPTPPHAVAETHGLLHSPPACQPQSLHAHPSRSRDAGPCPASGGGRGAA